MKPGDDTWLIEDNCISLRTAVVCDEGDLVYFKLLPASGDTALEGAVNYLKWDSTWLYRRKMSFFEELRIKTDRFGIKRKIRPMSFAKRPELKLEWSDCGQSVALYLNGEAWAFIHRDRNQGYSKGIICPSLPNPWRQDLFEKTFNHAD